MKLPGILISWASVLMFIILAIIIVIGIILYRMSMVLALAAVNDNTIKSNWSLIISMTGAAINLVLIIIFNYIYKLLANWLTENELHRSQTVFDDALTLKIYLFQFVNYYASIFYIAFFKGQFVGTPNEYTRFMSWRQEECSPGGCFIELCIQMAIIFIGKQFMMSVVEYCMPHIWKLFNPMKLAEWNSAKSGKDDATPQYIEDFNLVEWEHQGLFYEYLEMVLQYGFITIFVCAFPLAPFFALCKNVLELRLDAKRILHQHRKPNVQRVQSIGVWFEIMETLGKISVLTNACIIAFTTEFIPKAVYRGFYSTDGSLVGYVNFTLSYMDPQHIDRTSNHNLTLAPEYCRYPDYKTSPWEEQRYTNNIQFWHIWFARLLFVVIFEIVVACTIMATKLLIPDISSDLKYRIRREAYITKEIIIRRERLRKVRWTRNKSDSDLTLNSPVLKRSAGGVESGGGMESTNSAVKRFIEEGEDGHTNERTH